jgi:hypothetical protein
MLGCFVFRVAAANELSYLNNPHLIDILLVQNLEIEPYVRATRNQCAAKIDLNKEKSRLLNEKDHLQSKPDEKLLRAEKAKIDALEAKIKIFEYQLRECEEKSMNENPLQVTADLYDRATEASPKIGKIVLSLQPGGSIPDGWTYKIAFVDPAGKSHTAHIEDYSERESPQPYSVTGRSGSWIKLPKNPLAGPSWLNLSSFRGAPEPKPLSKYGWMETKTKTYSGVMRFKKIDGDYYIGEYTKPEPDFSCESEGKKLKYFKIKIPIKELYDEDLHLRTKREYLGTCLHEEP